MTKKRKTMDISSSGRERGLSPKVRKALENTATFGLLLVAVAIAVPFMNLDSGGWLAAFKWVYAAGALIFTVARVAGVNHPGDSFRLKRLRRLECWAGIAFLVGGFFWFYNEARFGGSLGFTLAILRETILFTLAGAMIQIIAVWMIYFREKKEGTGGNSGSSDNSPE